MHFPLVPRGDSRDAAASVDRFDVLEARPLCDGAVLYVTGNRRSRTRGLAGLDWISAEHALLIAPCRSVHTIGMRFALDLLWLDAAGQVVRLDVDVPARRMRTCLRARAVIETNVGCGQRFARLLAILPGEEPGAGAPSGAAGRAWQGHRERRVR